MSHRLLRSRLFPTLVIPWAAAASCDSPSSDGARVTPQDLMGTYFLESVRGAPLPTSLTQSVSITYEAVLRLEADDRYTLITDTGNCPAAGRLCTELHGQGGGRWLLLHDGSIDFQPGMTSSYLGSDRAVGDGQTIVFDSDLVYRRVNPAVQARSIDIRPDSIVMNLTVFGSTHNIFATTTPYSPNIAFTVKDETIATLELPAIRARARGVTYVVATSGTARDSSKIIVQ